MIKDPACRGPVRPSCVETREGERYIRDDIGVGPVHEP
jgi:hypothetical protein